MKDKQPWQALQAYLPDGSLDYVLPLILDNKVHLTITKPRRTKLGDYRLPMVPYENHKITINGNLNKYEFLITLLHELAHMLSFVKYGRRIAPHGIEWQMMYKQLVLPTLHKPYFPENIKKALIESMQAPAATCAGELELMRVLRQYNAQQNATPTVEQIQLGTYFLDKKGELFKVEKKLRSRYLCTHMQSHKQYAFPALYPVKPFEVNDSTNNLLAY
jgi:SprT protein